MVVWKRDIKNKAKCKPRAEELPGGSAKGINLRNVVLNLETYYTQVIYSYTNINQLFIISSMGRCYGGYFRNMATIYDLIDCSTILYL